MTTKHFRILFSTLAVTLIAAIAYAQTTTGAFLGFVNDSAGAAIKGANVTATNEATGFTRTVTTNSSGEYVIALLPVGQYTLTFEAPNFKRRAIEKVRLELDQKAKVNAALEVGQVTEAITIDDANSAPLTRTETAEAGEVI
jgi:Carboxypeptidase regulatory-like domain